MVEDDVLLGLCKKLFVYKVTLHRPASDPLPETKFEVEVEHHRYRTAHIQCWLNVLLENAQTFLLYMRVSRRFHIHCHRCFTRTKYRPIDVVSNSTGDD